MRYWPEGGAPSVQLVRYIHEIDPTVNLLISHQLSYTSSCIFLVTCTYTVFATVAILYIYVYPGISRHHG